MPFRQLHNANQIFYNMVLKLKNIITFCSIFFILVIRYVAANDGFEENRQIKTLQLSIILVLTQQLLLILQLQQSIVH